MKSRTAKNVTVLAITRGPSQLPIRTNRYVAAQIRTAKPAKHMRDKKERPICLSIPLSLVVVLLFPYSSKNGFTICLCDSYSLSPLYRSTSNHTKESAARRPRSTALTAAYMTAQITNATPYIIASTNGCSIYVSNVESDLG